MASGSAAKSSGLNVNKGSKSDTASVKSSQVKSSETRRSHRTVRLPEYLKDYELEFSKHERVHSKYKSDSGLYKPDIPLIGVDKHLHDRQSLSSSEHSVNSQKSVLSRHSVLSVTQTAELETKRKRAQYEELKRQLEEDEWADMKLSQLDEEAFAAQQAADRQLQESREIQRRAAKQREMLSTKISRERRLRKAEKEAEEADLVTAMIDMNIDNGEIKQPALPAPVPVTQTKLSVKAPSFNPREQHPARVYPNHGAQEPPLPSPHVTVPPRYPIVYHPPVNQFQYASELQTQNLTELLISSSYGIPKPTLPTFSSGKESDFARLEIALKNLIDIHPHLTEQYKFQILLEKLGGSVQKLAEAYRSHPQPYTMALRALKEKYGQPRQLVQSEINQIMKLPSVRYGDNDGFDNFALSVLSLVGILQSVEGEDSYELRCGSHVDRLLSKLPQTNRDSFIEHCLTKGILTADGRNTYTLSHFSNWLQIKARAKRIAAATSFKTEFNSNVTTRKQEYKTTSPTVMFSTNTNGQKRTPNNQKSSVDDKGEVKPRFNRVPYCPYCNNEDHYLHKCSKFKLMSTNNILEWIKQDQRCYKCARFHKPERCSLKKPCHECDGIHLTALHAAIQRGADKMYSVTTSDTQSFYADQPSRPNSVLLKLVKILLYGPNGEIETFALLDDGSMRSMILQPAVKKLNLSGKPDKVLLTTIRKEPFWCNGSSVDLQISSIADPDQRYDIKGAFSSDNLSLSQYSYPVEELQAEYPHLRDFPLSPITEAKPMILIGSDHADLLLPKKPIQFGPNGTPVAICTSLGWTLQGPNRETLPKTDTHSYLTVEKKKCTLMNNVEKLWQMDVIPYSEKKVVRSKQDTEALNMLESQTVRVDIDGVQRYATPLLRAKDCPKFSTTKDAVMPTWRRTEKRLSHHPVLAEVHKQQIDKLVKAGYVKILTEEEVQDTEESWYFPHHVVEHNGKHRLVFNCSFSYSDIILNKYLLPGPTLGPTLLGVLIRFRQHCVAISGDIQAMFHQVRVLPKDRALLRFIWRSAKTGSPPDTYEWQVLPFGTTCSPCCATYALQKHVSENADGDEEIVRVVTESFYVDNCLHSTTSATKAKNLLSKLRETLSTGGFNIRQWACNIPAVVEEIPPDARSDGCDLWLNLGDNNSTEPTLGLQWDCKTDTLRYRFRPITYKELTMKIVYKILATQYDPIGYLSPYLARAKMIVQDLWRDHIDWDAPIQYGPLYDKWMNWERELVNIPDVKIPRCYTSNDEVTSEAHRQVHVFCDASERIYGAVAYLRTQVDVNSVSVNFLAARSRVAPKKQQTIPRLELSAALTGAQLADVVARELTVPIDKTVLWSDSTTVLAWLQSESCRYKVFVGTRVAEIQTLTKMENWHYVNTTQNPADDITRGKTLNELNETSIWLNGPTFLYSSPDKWPTTVRDKSLDREDDTELKKTFCGTVTTLPTIPLPNFKEYTAWDDLVSASKPSLHGAATDDNGDQLVSKLEEAEIRLFRQVQTDSFPEELSTLSSGKDLPSSSRLHSLCPVYDRESGLIKVGGRLRNCEVLTDSEKHPIILDPRHHITKLLIKNYDVQLLHYGPERILAEIRRKFWILRGREAIRKHQHQCVECRKWKTNPVVPKMNDLPQSRLRLFKPVFYSTGVDCFGPMSVKIGRRNEKRWGVIFKCMTTRAVHLDLLESLDTDAFLMSFRRFVSRRGKPFELLSDQGTNFKGADSELQQAFASMEPVLRERLADQKVRWQFNPPLAPHFGGVWEREIKSLKHGLRVVLRNQTVTEAVLQTVLIEVEGILNSKPLGYVSTDASDIDPITPNLLLMGRRDPSLPQIVYPTNELMGRRRWRHSQILADQFWSHFTKYYLPDMQLRRKWYKETEELAPGDVVMIVDPQLVRSQWPIGKVTETIASSDQRVRAAKVDAGNRQFVRPVAKLVRLPEFTD